MCDMNEQQAGTDLLSVKDVLAEKRDRLLRGLSEIDQAWKNRLSWEWPAIIEAWRNGNTAMLLKFSPIRGGKCNGIIPTYYGIAHAKPPCAALDGQVLDGRNRIDGNDHVVFVEIVEPSERPEDTISTFVGMRLQFIENKRLSLWEGALYRRLSDGVFDVVPSFVKGECRTCLFARSVPLQGGPDVVENAAQIMDRVTDGCAHEERLVLASIKDRDLSVFRIVLDHEMIRIRTVKTSSQGIELIDVAFGPLKL